ncbi:hypothetical protein HD553DRAFT_17843 [Filobasidium floriforme]|uniref:uncharacterized protein n=1 Tax=Filobasidium floriforme TaxID=5210 RepID=UPI001E8EDF67|nr:uncharacterized protein HD553DRAFT_17843 [Filobasidium floriforme]KAH8090830.1 hypothetical protein HD553DRAFT_17843 [Filobasidium floriforme]
MPRQTSKAKEFTPQTKDKALPPATPNPPLSPLIQSLRRDWRWASISQFLWTFGQAAGLSSWDIDLFEADLDSPEPDVLVPETVVKFLYTLTYDKTVNRNNLERKLQTEYISRSPKQNPFGTDLKREPRPWAELGLGEKVDALYRVCEWQWANPQRFRALLGDDEPTAWRVEPIGWDKDENCYWLFDDNRLWVQHPAPKPPKPPPKPKTNSKKAKQAARAKNKAAGTTASSTRKTQEKKPKTVAAEPMDEDQPESSTARRSGRGRAASPSLDVIQKLIAEEKGLRSTRKRSRDEATSDRMREEAESTPTKRLRDRSGKAAPAGLSFSTPTKMAGSANGNPASGSRSTRRTRATEEVWQPIPEEWLTPSKTRGSASNQKTPSRLVNEKNQGKGKGKEKEKPKIKTGLESDSDSELSELSDEEEEKAEVVQAAPISTRATSSDLSPDPDQEDEGVHKGASRQSTPLSEPEAEPEGGSRVDGPAEQNMDKPETPKDMGQADEPMEGVEAEQSTRRSVTPIKISDESTGEKVASPEIEMAPPTGKTDEHELADEKMEVDEKAGDAVDVTAPMNTAETGETASSGEGQQQAEGDKTLPPKGDVTDGADAIAQEGPAQVEEEPLKQTDREAEGSSKKEDQAGTGLIPDDVNAAEQEAEPEAMKEEVVEEEEEEITDEVMLAARKALNPGFLEWECVCATRWDWENWPEQFAGSRHPDEKAFYAHLVENTRPAVLVHLREKEIQRAKEEAVRNRKRSSRIAMRELEKEEAAKMEEVRRDLERRMQKVRDEEAKEAAAEADRLAKEREREDRLKDREERLKQREEAIAQRAIEEIRAKEEAERAREIRAQKRLAGESAATESRSGTPEGKASKGKGKKTEPQALATEEADNDDEEEEEDEEPWELACEICKQHGWNVDDGRNICCCESCGRWQHTDCHDKHDEDKGNKRRNWNRVTFYCGDCRRRKARERHSARKAAQNSPAQAGPEQASPTLRFSIPQQFSPTANRSQPRSTPQNNGQVPSLVHPSQAQASGSRPRLSPQKMAAQPTLAPASQTRPSVSPVGHMSNGHHHPQAANGHAGQAPVQRSGPRPEAPHYGRDPRANGTAPARPAAYQHQGSQNQSPVIYHAGYPPRQGNAYVASPQGTSMRSPPAPNAPQLYLQSGQPVYRQQIQPGHVQASQSGYQQIPLANQGNSSTPARNHPSQSPIQHAIRPVQAAPTPQQMYVASPPGAVRYVQGQPYYPAQAPMTSDLRYSGLPNGGAAGHFQQPTRPPPNGQAVPPRPIYNGYAPSQVDSQRYMQQQGQPYLDPRA